MQRALRSALAAAASFVVACAGESPPSGRGAPDSAAQPATLRVALFNVMELDAAKVGRPDDPQLAAAAAIVARLRPDVLVLQEVDAPPEDPGAVARRFAERYLAPAGVELPHVFAAPSNTGRLSGHDLDGDGVVATEADLGTRAYGDDSFGYGEYPGQYGMAVLSRLPIAAGEARTFRDFPWRELPGHHLPPGFYSPEELAVLPLSSKSHWDVPVEIAGGRRLRLLVSHPTPPVFDGDEDRNGRRNFDEIAFWLHYLDGSPALVDDRGRAGGLAPGSLFVLAGDLNADPLRPSSTYEGTTAIRQLLAHPLLVDPADVLVSAGGRLHGRGGEPRAEQVTAEFAGGMRVDYLLPSRRLTVADGGLFWPSPEADPEGHRLATAASDHHLLWLELRLPD
ncbi:MAG TPA: endonuclease/exonuclease/phosphatase family protein [Thermoanaerobaculia bacterium]|nr:endonuclease/exonuclease/phosphatase family protein [Thermoanaerobaculia bacterium]